MRNFISKTPKRCTASVRRESLYLILVEGEIPCTLKYNLFFMSTITKKITPEYFEEIYSGKKKFEVRLADFDISEGDTIRLEEWTSIDTDRKPTGRYMEKVVTFVRKVEIQEWVKTQPEIEQKGFYVIQFD